MSTSEESLSTVDAEEDVATFSRLEDVACALFSKSQFAWIKREQHLAVPA